MTIEKQIELDNLLFDASIHDDVKGIKNAIKAGADVNAKDGDERTPLMLAMHYKSHKAAKLLIKKGADIKARDRYNKTPIDYGTKETVEIVFNQRTPPKVV